MKALKRQLASELLADPQARDPLRQFMTKPSSPHAARDAATGEFRIHRDDKLSARECRTESEGGLTTFA